MGARTEESGRFISIKVQRENISRWAAAHDVSVAWFVEVDASGGDGSRRAWNAAIEACERGELAGFVCSKLDRFARSSKDASVALARLELAGARFVSVEESLDDATPMGRFARDMMLRMAQLERERYAEMWAVASKRAIDDGVHVAVTPIGYRRQRDVAGKALRAPLILDPKMAPKVKRAFAMRAAGATLRDVAASLSLSLSGAQGMLRNEAYLGVAKAPRGLRKPGAHPAIVAPELWRDAQAYRNPQARTGQTASRGVLVGTLRCAGCRYRMPLGTGGVYACRGTHAGGRCPAPAGISVARADGYVLALVAEIAADPGHPDGRYLRRINREDSHLEQAQRERQAASDHVDEWLSTSINQIGRRRWEQQLERRQQALYDAEDQLDVLARAQSLTLASDSPQRQQVIETRVYMKRLFRAIYVRKADPALKGGLEPAARRMTLAWRRSPE